MLPRSVGGDGVAAKEGDEKVYSGMFTDEMSIGDMVWGRPMGTPRSGGELDG